jgi:hypothetical protein
MSQATSFTEGIKTQCENHAECLKMIQAILDGHASNDEKDHFRDNMDRCLPCIEMYRLEKCVKESLQNRITKVPCPDNILAAIQAKLKL